MKCISVIFWLAENLQWTVSHSWAYCVQAGKMFPYLMQSGESRAGKTEIKRTKQRWMLLYWITKVVILVSLIWFQKNWETDLGTHNTLYLLSEAVVHSCSLWLHRHRRDQVRARHRITEYPKLEGTHKNHQRSTPGPGENAEGTKRVLVNPGKLSVMSHQKVQEKEIKHNCNVPVKICILKSLPGSL